MSNISESGREWANQQSIIPIMRCFSNSDPKNANSRNTAPIFVAFLCFGVLQRNQPKLAAFTSENTGRELNQGAVGRTGTNSIDPNQFLRSALLYADIAYRQLPAFGGKMICQSKTIAMAMMLGAAVPSTSFAESIGEASFMSNCAVCHGADGKGNGPIVDFLKSAPSDLTMISAHNGGMFPIENVYQVIADTDLQRAHGTNEMPIWGNRFNSEVIAQEGEYGSGSSGQQTAQARILELVYFLATIQEPM